MLKSNPITNREKITRYIAKHTDWSTELETLRELFGRTELVEEMKWGSPTYTLNNKIVAGFAGFKKHYAIWFHQGVFLKDTEKILLNAQEGKTKALRQWRFEAGDAIPEDLVLAYIREAIQNSIEGKELKPMRKSGVILPSILENAFSENPELKTAFNKLTIGKQREYAEHIGSAKLRATQESRLKSAIPLIFAGKGLNDKYKKC